jgi:hypothetical protein
MDELITVETDLFEHRKVKPHFINPFYFSEDLAEWLKEQLAPLVDFGINFRKLSRKTTAVGGISRPPAQWSITILG